MTVITDTCGIIILAAGSSSRLGQPKQLLQYKNKSLIRLIADEALDASSKTVVVSGANKTLVESELDGLQIRIIHNPEWEEGMASSIRCGLKEAMKLFPGLENIIITVCDQPFITSKLFKDLMKMKSLSQKGIIASEYKIGSGVPVLFDKKYFDELLNLQGQQGAKKLLETFSGDVAFVSFPEGDIDIDSMDDYKKL